MEHLNVFLISSLLFFRSLTGDTSEFKLVKQDNAISLYERWIPGAGGENVREIKAVFLVRCAVPAVVGLFKDQAHGRDWNTNASEYKIVPAPDPLHWITYIRYDIPWPVDDQDCCLLYRLRETNGSAEVVFESINDQRFPLYNKTTRITGTRGKWIMEPTPGGPLRITYIVTTDRSRKIPRWVSDPIIHDNLFRTMTKFKGLLENKTYAQQ
ncbi:START domain-containing protein [Chitinophaga arvensicola]|uniref:START domain-containing protein n=1 Tax=Chitinophaga arvensicola TaxID=29529 RepID=A0A1I0RP77_9BACT|nr:START domain-containing protein [Chitinophaga arvensicola]SEW42987.1 START domain-containing protein [Chitinophaga arvensicola]